LIMLGTPQRKTASAAVSPKSDQVC